MSHEYDRRPIRVSPEALMLPVSGTAFRALMALFRFVNSSMKAWPSLDALLMYLPGWDRRNLQRALRELRDHPLEILRVADQHTEEGGQMVNKYTIHLPSLKKIREFLERQRSAHGGVNFATGRASISPPPRLNRTELKSLKRTKRGGEGRPRSPSLPSAQKNLQTLIDHWKTVYAKKRKVPAPATARLRWILRDLLDSIGLAGARAAVDLWFEKSYRVDWSTFDFSWAGKASEKAYAPEEFERRINAIVQAAPFLPLKNKYEGGTHGTKERRHAAGAAAGT